MKKKIILLSLSVISLNLFLVGCESKEENHSNQKELTIEREVFYENIESSVLGSSNKVIENGIEFHMTTEFLLKNKEITVYIRNTTDKEKLLKYSGELFTYTIEGLDDNVFVSSSIDSNEKELKLKSNEETTITYDLSSDLNKLNTNKRYNLTLTPTFFTGSNEFFKEKINEIIITE